VVVKIPYDGRQLICVLPQYRLWKRDCTPGAEWGTLDRLPWRNVLSTLFRNKKEPSYDNYMIVSFHLDHNDSERAWNRAVTRPIPPVDKTELDAMSSEDRTVYEYYEATADLEKLASSWYPFLGDD
jgi:hypothetical protein